MLLPAVGEVQCYIAPSVIHRTLLCCVASAAMLAIAITSIPVPLQTLAVLTVISGLAYQLKALSTPIILTHYSGPDDTTNCWQIQRGTHSPIEATLIASGYRSSIVLVLALQADTSRQIHYVPIWCDAIEPSHYSYLNLQLLFNTENKESQDSR